MSNQVTTAHKEQYSLKKKSKNVGTEELRLSFFSLNGLLQGKWNGVKTSPCIQKEKKTIKREIAWHMEGDLSYMSC